MREDIVCDRCGDVATIRFDPPAQFARFAPIRHFCRECYLDYVERFTPIDDADWPVVDRRKLN